MVALTSCISGSLRFSLGQTCVEIENAPSEQAIPIPAAYRPFITTADADIRLRLKLGEPSLEGWDCIFANPPIWSLYRRQGQRVFSIFSGCRGRAHSFCLFDDQPGAEIRFSQGFSRPLDPFCGPDLELLTIEQLAAGCGCLLHGCGIRLSNSGILFAGASGAGKSTMLRLWAGEKDALVLSDDRTIAQGSGAELRIYGTPWHGKERYGLAHGARLAAIFFLKHGALNKMRQLSPADAVRRLLTCSFPPLWDGRGMAAALDFLSFIGHSIACFELEFVPDATVVAYIRRWFDSSQTDRQPAPISMHSRLS